MFKNKPSVKNELINHMRLNGIECIEFDEQIDFHNFSVIMCTEYGPFGDEEEFELIYKEGKFYNSNFDQWPII